VGRTPWTGDQPVAGLLTTHRTTQTENIRTQTPIPPLGFEATISVLETVHALDRATTVIGIIASRHPKCRSSVAQICTQLSLCSSRPQAGKTCEYTSWFVHSWSRHWMQVIGLPDASVVLPMEHQLVPIRQATAHSEGRNENVILIISSQYTMQMSGMSNKMDRSKSCRLNSYNQNRVIA
jgi:hypothetical protein